MNDTNHYQPIFTPDPAYRVHDEIMKHIDDCGACGLLFKNWSRKRRNAICERDEAICERDNAICERDKVYKQLALTRKKLALARSNMIEAMKFAKDLKNKGMKLHKVPSRQFVVLAHQFEELERKMIAKGAIKRNKGSYR